MKHTADKDGVKRRIPCFALLDGKHFAIEHPPHSGSLNANYKGFFSFNTLMLCDSDLRLMYCQISELGVNSDAQLFRDGPLKSILDGFVRMAGFRMLPDQQTLMPPFLLTDNGFALTHSTMQPYRQNAITAENYEFNKRISAVRVRVENAFGVLTSKFRILRRDMNLDPASSRALVVALSVIHNIQIGPLQIENVDSTAPMMANPYVSPEDQRSALKNFLLYH